MFKWCYTVAMSSRKPARRIDKSRVEDRLEEMIRRGEAEFQKPTEFGPLPEIKLARKVRLDRIIRLAKR